MFRALKRLLHRGALDPAQLALPLALPLAAPPHDLAVPPLAGRSLDWEADGFAPLALDVSPAPTQIRSIAQPESGVLTPRPAGTTVRIPRRRRSAEEIDAAAAVRLVVRHAEFNTERFGGVLRPIGIEVSRRLRSRLGYYRVATPRGPGFIAISRRHLRRHGWDEAFETLLHEMVHQWQDESGLPVDHGTQFRAKARAVGCVPRARRQVG